MYRSDKGCDVNYGLWLSSFSPLALFQPVKNNSSPIFSRRAVTNQSEAFVIQVIALRHSPAPDDNATRIWLYRNPRCSGHPRSRHGTSGSV